MLECVTSSTFPRSTLIPSGRLRSEARGDANDDERSKWIFMETGKSEACRIDSNPECEEIYGYW